MIVDTHFLTLRILYFTSMIVFDLRVLLSAQLPIGIVQNWHLSLHNWHACWSRAAAGSQFWGDFLARVERLSINMKCRSFAGFQTAKSRIYECLFFLWVCVCVCVFAHLCVFLLLGFMLAYWYIDDSLLLALFSRCFEVFAKWQSKH